MSQSIHIKQAAKCFCSLFGTSDNMNLIDEKGGTSLANLCKCFTHFVVHQTLVSNMLDDAVIIWQAEYLKFQREILCILTCTCPLARRSQTTSCSWINNFVSIFRTSLMSVVILKSKLLALQTRFCIYRAPCSRTSFKQFLTHNRLS